MSVPQPPTPESTLFDNIKPYLPSAFTCGVIAGVGLTFFATHVIIGAFGGSTSIIPALPIDDLPCGAQIVLQKMPNGGTLAAFRLESGGILSSPHFAI